MDYLNSILSQTPEQSVEEAIPTLCDRLQHATLSSDRRSAVLGLKSFSRQYRESVVEYGLRPLVATFKKDSAIPENVKSILETFLILFIRGDGEDLTRGWISQQSRLQNGKYPSPILMEDISIDQFSLWIADELTQDLEIIELILKILSETEDFHIRLYSIQLLEALVATRGVKTKDCLLQIPTAFYSLVLLLNDTHDPVRNEAILLLMSVVNNNFNIQKLVAFENTFDRLFEIIDEEGGIRGSILVQDCLTLITNLLQYNASNQKYFLETKGVPKLAELLGEPIEEDSWTNQRLQNMIIALEICRTFVNEDNELLTENQNKLFDSEIHFIILRMIFSPATNSDIRTTCLEIAGDLIRSNLIRQFWFSQVDVPYLDPSLTYQAYDKTVPVPIALLNWCLFINSVRFFDLRIKALGCLSSYFKDNDEAKGAFLSDQISAYKDEAFWETNEANGLNGHELNGNSIASPFGNIFSTLMDYDSELKLNPYKLWLSAAVLINLFQVSKDNTTESNNAAKENRKLARDVKTGDGESGEEVMNCIQAISGLLVTTLDNPDPRMAIGYLMLLTVWIFEDFEAVNDFLSDTSVIKSLLAFLTNNSAELAVLIHGMATMLLGIAFEFSTKDSPIPRAELHSILVKSLGRDNYTLKIQQFKNSDYFKNFDDQKVATDNTGLPDVFFDETYVALIKENFPRIRKALFHDPLSEPRGRITYELFEDLDTKYTKLSKQIQDEEKVSTNTKVKLEEEIGRINKAYIDLGDQLKSTENDLEKLTDEYSTVAANYEATKRNLALMETQKTSFEASSQKYFKELQDALKNASSSGDTLASLKSLLNIEKQQNQKHEDGINKMTRELFQLTKQKTDAESKIKVLEKEIAQLKNEIQTKKKNHDAQIQALNLANEGLKLNGQELTKQLNDAMKKNSEKVKVVEGKLEDTEANNAHLMDKLRSASIAFLELKTSKVLLEEEITSLKSGISVVSEKDEIITEKEKAILDKAAELKIKDGIIVAKEKIIAQQEKLITEKDEELSQIDDALTEKELELAEKDVTLSERELLLSEQEGQNSKKDATISEFESALASKKEELLSKEEALTALNLSLNSKEEEITTLKTELFSKGDEISKFKEDLLTKDTHITTLQEKHAITTTKVASLESIQVEFDTLKTANAKLTSQYDELRENTEIDLEILQTQVKHLKALNTQLTSENLALKSEIENLKVQLQSTDSTNGELIELLNLKNTKLLEEYSQLKVTMFDQRAELEQKIKDAEEDSKRAANDAKLSTEAIQRTTEELNVKIKKISESKVSLEKEISDLQLVKSDFEKKILILESDALSKNEKLLLSQAKVSETSKQLEMLQVKADENLKELTATKKKLSEVDAKLTKTTESYTSLESTAKDLQLQLGESASELAALKLSSENYKSEKEALIAELSKKVDSLSTEIVTHKEAIRARDQEVINHKTAIEVHKKEIDEHKIKHTKNNKDIETHKKAIASLTDDVKAHEDLVAGLKGEVATHKELVGTLQGEVETHKSSISALQREVVTHKESGATLTKELTTNKNGAASLKKELITHKGVADSLKKELAAEKLSSATVSKELAASKGIAATLTKDLAAEKDSANDLKQEVTTYKDKAATLKNEITTHQGEAATLKGSVATLNEELASHKKAAATLNKEITTHKGTIQSQAKKLQVHQEQSEAQKKEILIHKSLIESKEVEIEEHKQKIASQEMELEGHSKIIDSHKKEINANIKEISLQKQNITSQEIELEGQSKTIDSHKEEINSNLEAIDSHKLVINNHAKEIKAHKEDIDSHKHELSLREAELAAHKSQIEKLKSNITALQLKFEESEAVKLKLADQLKTLTQAKTDLEKSKKSLDVQLVDLQKEKALLVRDLESSAAEVKLSASKIQAHESTLEENSALIAELKLSQSNLQAKVSSLEATKGDLSSKLQAHATSLEENIALIAESELSRSNLKTQVSTLEAAKGDLSSRIKVSEKLIQTQKAKNAKEIESLQGQLSDKDLKISTLESDLKGKIVEIERERAMISQNSESVISEYGDKIKVLELKLTEANTEHSSKLSALAKQKLELEKKLEGAEEEKDIIKSESEGLKLRIEVAEKKLLDEKTVWAAKEKELKNLKAAKTSWISKEKELTSLVEGTKKDLTLKEQNLVKLRESNEKELTALKEAKKVLEAASITTKKELASSTSKIEAVQAKLISKVSELEEKDKEITTVNSALKSALEKATSSNEEHKSAIAVLEKSLQEHKLTVGEFETQVKELTTKNQSLSSSSSENEKKLLVHNQNLEHERSKLSNEITTLREKSATIAERLNSEIVEFTKKIHNSEAHAVKYLAKITELEAQNAKKDSKVTELEAQNTKSSKRITQLEAQNLSSDEKTSQLRSESEAKVAALEAELTNSSTKLKSLQAEITKLTSELETLALSNKEISTLQEQLNAKEKQIATSLKDAALSISTLKSEVSSLKAQVTSLEADLTSTKSESNKKESSKVTDLESEVRTLKSDLKGSKDAAAKSKKVVDDSSKAQLVLKDELQLLKSALKLKEEELSTANINFQKLKDDLQIKQNEASTLAKDSKLLESTLKAKEALINGNNTSIQTIKDLEVEILELKNSRNEAESKITNSERAHKEVVEKHKEVVKTHDLSFKSKAAEITELETKLKLKEDSIVKFTFEIEKLKAEVESSKKLHNVIEDLKKTAEIDKSDLKKTTENGSAELKKMAEKLAILEKENKDLEKKMVEETKKLLFAEKEKADLQKVFELQKVKQDSEALLKIKQGEEALQKVKQGEEALQKIKQENEAAQAKLSGEVEKLKTKLKLLVPKSDLDDLMLLMSDMDETNSKYKLRLKALGEDVSSDEDDDDDED